MMIAQPQAATALPRFAWLSIAAAIITIGLLSDAIESLVNLVAAIMALVMLTLATQPADEEHTYGRSKAEYFSSGVEGTLIVLAAASIGGIEPATSRRSSRGSPNSSRIVAEAPAFPAPGHRTPAYVAAPRCHRDRRYRPGRPGQSE